MTNYSHIGLLSAMKEEVGDLINNLDNVVENIFGDLVIYSGEWKNSNNLKIYLSVAFSGWGKVSAARATTRLISINYKNTPIQLLIFTGVAGAANKLRQWDIVFGTHLFQHDMDARPIFDKFVIPPLNQKELVPDQNILNFIYSKISNNDLILKHQKFGKLFKGIIVSGDKFINDKKTLEEINKDIPNILAVEMEGAAFAQVALQEKIPWLVIRVISDNAMEGSDEDFVLFLENYKKYSNDLISALIETFV